MSSVAPPNQKREALQPIRYDPITDQLCTLGDNCNDMLSSPQYDGGDLLGWHPSPYQSQPSLPPGILEDATPTYCPTVPPHQPQCPLPANLFLAYHHPRHHEGTRTRAERLFVLRTPHTLSTAPASSPIKRGWNTPKATPEPTAPIPHTHNGSKTAVLLADPCQRSVLLAQSVACASNLQGLPARAEGSHPAIFHGSTSHRCSLCLLRRSVVKITMS